MKKILSSPGCQITGKDEKRNTEESAPPKILVVAYPSSDVVEAPAGLGLVACYTKEMLMEGHRAPDKEQCIVLFNHAPDPRECRVCKNWWPRAMMAFADVKMGPARFSPIRHTIACPDCRGIPASEICENAE